jgi:hypothetical protein
VCSWQTVLHSETLSQKKKKKNQKTQNMDFRDVLKEMKNGPSMVVHACNPSSAEGGDERIMLQDKPLQKSYPDPISKTKPGMMVHVYNPSLNSGPTPGATPPALFYDVYFEELFAQAGCAS